MKFTFQSNKKLHILSRSDLQKNTSITQTDSDGKVIAVFDARDSVAFLVNSLITTYGLTNDDIYNHEDIQPKTAGEGRAVITAIQPYINPANNAPPNPLKSQNNNQDSSE